MIERLIRFDFARILFFFVNLRSRHTRTIIPGALFSRDPNFRSPNRVFDKPTREIDALVVPRISFAFEQSLYIKYH